MSWTPRRAQTWAALAAAAATVACGGATPRPTAPAATTPSVIFITVDTLRADRLGAYGSTATKTPRLDDLGRHCVVFRRAYATLPRTAPALSSLMTGHYPSTHGVRRNGAVLVDSEVTLAERLRNAGYTTAAFISNKVMNSKHGLEQGFSLYDENLPDPVITRDESERTATNLVDAALAWADRPHTKPIFLWVHFIDPHGPYTPPGFESKNPPAARTMPVSKLNFEIDAIPAYQALPGRLDPDEYVDRYNGEVDYTDSEVGRLLDGLRRRGVSDGAYVLFSADHGESLGDHHRWFQHGSSLFEAQMRVPLMISGPSIVPHEEAVAVSSVDVVPTFLEILGLPMSADLQGTSLRALLAGGDAGAAAAASIGRRLLFTELWDRRAAISGSWKLIWKVGESTAELYDVAADPEELRDVSGSHGDVARPMLAAIVRFARENTKDESPLDDEETRKTLKALGYIN